MTNRKLYIIALLLTLILGASCSDKERDLKVEEEESPQLAVEDRDAMKGTIRVLLSKELGDRIELRSTSDGVLRASDNHVDGLLRSLGAKTMERVFPYAGKFEERTRREGLHLWYDITFDEELSVTRAASEATEIPGVEYVEKVYPPIAPTFMVVDYNPQQALRADGIYPYDDPYLPDQWHYYNRANKDKYVAGADINLLEAWKIETGKPNVIVSVVDAGIDYNHEDLKDNMWINEAELNGTPGVDDDGNGYIDDIYGYNFTSNVPEIVPDLHGTHVGGTIAAKNNNGIGVSGIAGGDGTPNSGVRLMSCQIFEGRKGQGAPAGIKYGADNGAVISQNSWGYAPGVKSLARSDQVAIDYFIKYAGCDNEGNQLPNSPMKGGVVIFAAGNDGLDYTAQPGAYEPVVAVGSIGPDMKPSYFTNRGGWMDVMAPGGNKHLGGHAQVLSTIPGNRYYLAQGTSMACPHVSGIAALVVSKFGGPGFTNKDLENRLMTGLKRRDINEDTPQYAGRLGRGYIDAARALAEDHGKAPEKVEAVAVEDDFVDLHLSWSAVNDEDDGSADHYMIYYSDKAPLTAANFTSGTALKVDGFPYKKGEQVRYTVQELQLNTQYYLAIQPVDRWGHKAEPTFFKGKTKENHAPVITPAKLEPYKITGSEVVEIDLAVTDPDGHDWTYSIEGERRGVTSKKSDGKIHITINNVAPVGKYTSQVVVADIFDFKTTITIEFEIYNNNPPTLIKEFGQLFIPTGKDYVIPIAEHIVDPDGHELKFEVRSSNPSLATVTIADGNLVISPKDRGPVNFQISVSDTQGASLNTTIKAQVVRGGLVYIVYPNPVKDVMNIRLADEVKQAKISIMNQSGVRLLEKEVSTPTSDEKLVKLDLSNLAGGTYFLFVEANSDKHRQTFIKI